MEFQGQRGDPAQAWSVGKYAKRSTTIHLCSEDVQQTESAQFEADVASVVLGEPGQDSGLITIFDRGKKIRDFVQSAGTVKAHVSNNAVGSAHRDVELTVAPAGNIENVVVDGASVAGESFTTLQNVTKYGTANARGLNVFEQQPVRAIDTGQDYNNLGSGNPDGRCRGPKKMGHAVW